MGYQTSGVLIAEPPTDEALATALRLPPVTTEVCDWLKATSMQTTTMSIARTAGWWLLVDQTYSRAYDALSFPGSDYDTALVGLSAGRQIIAFASVGHSDVYGFAVYRDGACVRRWLTSESEVELDEGPALAEEGSDFAEQVDEEGGDVAVFGLMEKLVPWNNLLEAKFQLLEPPAPPPKGKSRKQK